MLNKTTSHEIKYVNQIEKVLGKMGNCKQVSWGFLTFLDTVQGVPGMKKNPFQKRIVKLIVEQRYEKRAGRVMETNFYEVTFEIKKM